MHFSTFFCVFVSSAIFFPSTTLAQWTSLSTAGGDQGSLCVQGNTLFMGGTSGKLWRSTNQGTTWLASTGYLSGTSSTYALASDGTTMYASRVTERIIKSTDNGVTWNQVNNGIPAGYHPALLATRGKVYAGNANSGVFVSTDEGASWASANNGITDLTIRTLGGRGDTVFAGTSSGRLFRSTNAGQLWADVTPSYSTANTTMYFISVIDSSVFVGGISFGSMGLVRSDDWGASWVQDNDGISSILNLQAGGVVKIDTFLFVGMYSGGIYKRSVSVPSWSLVSGPQMLVQSPPVYPSTYHLSVIGVASQGTTVFVQTSPVGLFRSTNLGASWQQVSSMAGGGFDRRGLVKRGDTMYVGGDGGVFISTDNGGFWNTYQANVFAAARISSFAIVDTLMFAGQMNLGYGVLRSTDGGRFWIRVNSGLTTLGSRNINKLAIIGSTIFAGTATGIFVSSNLGESWSATAFPNQYVSELHAHGSTLFAFSQYLLSRSSDMGQTWATITNGIDPWDWVDVTSTGSRLLLAGGGIFTSTNDGISWTNITGNLAPVQFYAVATAGDTIYTATAFNCYYTVNLGQTWTLIPNSGFPLTPSFRHLMVHGGYIYAGMGESGNLGGAWKHAVPGTTSVERIDDGVPDNISLMQNYPNPFNPTTRIQFSVEKYGPTSLQVYDVLGREVGILANENMHPGSYSVSWDASDMPSGVYFSRLESGGVSITKRMLLIK